MLRTDAPTEVSPRAASFVLGVEEARRGLVWRELLVDPREVVFVKSIVEASEGVCSIFGERGGRLVFASPPEREAELEELVEELREELVRAARARLDRPDTDRRVPCVPVLERSGGLGA